MKDGGFAEYGVNHVVHYVPWIEVSQGKDACIPRTAGS